MRSPQSEVAGCLAGESGEPAQGPQPVVEGDQQHPLLHHQLGPVQAVPGGLGHEGAAVDEDHHGQELAGLPVGSGYVEIEAVLRAGDPALLQLGAGGLPGQATGLPPGPGRGGGGRQEAERAQRGRGVGQAEVLLEAGGEGGRGGQTWWVGSCQPVTWPREVRSETAVG